MTDGFDVGGLVSATRSGEESLTMLWLYHHTSARPGKLVVDDAIAPPSRFMWIH